MVSEAKKKTKMQLDELPDGLSDSSDLDDDLLFNSRRKKNTTTVRKSDEKKKKKIDVYEERENVEETPTTSGAISNSEDDATTLRKKKREKKTGIKRNEEESESENDASLKLLFSNNKDTFEKVEAKMKMDHGNPVSTRKRKSGGNSGGSNDDEKVSGDENTNSTKRQNNKSKKQLTFAELLKKNAEELEKERKQREMEESMVAKHEQQEKEDEEVEEMYEEEDKETDKLFKQALDKEKADKLHQELDMRPEPKGRMKTIASKVLMKKSKASVEGGGVYEVENFEETFELFPDGPVCKAFMQRAKDRSEHMNLCAELLLGRWLRYAEKSKMCDDPNALFPWLLNVITHTSKNKEIVFAARDALIFALYENERQGGNGGESIIGSWYGDNMDTLTNTSFEAVLAVAKSERSWKQKRRSSVSRNSSTPIKNSKKKADDVVIVLDVESSKITTLAETPNAKISGTWSSQDALKALKKVGIDDSFPASEYDLMVKPTRRKKKNKKKESKGTVYEERPDVSVNVLGVVSAIRALCDYNYLQDEAPLTHAKSEKFDADGCAEIIKLIAKLRLDPRSDASGACFDACVKSILRCVSSCNTIDAASKKQFSMKLSQKLANAVSNDSSLPAVTFILRWFPVRDTFSACIRDGLALYGFRGCLKRIERGPPLTRKRQNDEDESDDESEEDVPLPSTISPVDASVDVEAFRVSFACSRDLAARALVGDALFSSRNPEFNNPDDVWQFVRLWDFADCVLNGGVSANTFDAANEGDPALQKVSKWISKMKSLIPKLSRIEAEAQFRSRVNDAQNWYNQEAHARAMGRHLNDEYGREPLYAFGTHHQHHQFLQKSPHEYALSMARGEESFHHRPHNHQEGLSVNKSEEEEETEQKQFSLANTKVYVYSSREISEIAKLAPKDCERVESEQLLHRMFLYSTQLRTSEKSEATHFFVPAYPECLRTQKKLDEKTIEGYYADVLKRLGRFQMSGGLDHVFVAPRVGMDAVFPNWRVHCANCLFLRASRDVRGQTTDVFREVVVPDAFSESEARKNDETAEKLKSKRQSHALISVLGDDDEAKRLRKIHKVSDTEDMRFRASFCVVIVPNDAEVDEDIDERNHWTKNIALALWSDCIPVLLHKKNANANDDDDHFATALLDALPLSDVLDYESFSISQAYKANTDDDELLDYLRAINARDRHEFARNGKRVRCAFVYDAGDSECSAALALGFALGKRGLQFPKSSRSFWGAHGVPLDGDGNIVSASSSSSSAVFDDSGGGNFETEHVFTYAPNGNDLNPPKYC
ncbi:unnamed protein product [Bathycoccus prasinos]